LGDQDREHWLYAITPDWMIRRLLVPSGLLGRVAGHNMARINAEMNRALVDMLELRGDEHVLEVGFGPGVAVRMLTAALPNGHVAGVDPSVVMLRQATRRNRDAIRAGRVDLRVGTVDSMPWPDGSFDAACSANAVQLWESLEGGAREVHRLLRPSGRLGISVHEYAGASLAGDVPVALKRAGFEDVSMHRKVDKSGPALHFLAHA
jgi:SAM-dependent methyltransferase